jgi:acyl-CoA dehydrogenase
MTLPEHGTRAAPADYPFLFQDRHRAIAERAAGIALSLEGLDERGETDAGGAGRAAVEKLAKGGLLAWCVPPEHGGSGAVKGSLEVLALCLVREEVARVSGIGDSMVALQALGSYPVALAGSEELKARYLPGVANGTRIAAFALTETGAGSDAAAVSTRAKKDGGGWALEGEKVFISNAGIADGYVVFARTSDEGPRGLSAFFVEPQAALTAKPTPLIAAHPLGTVTLAGAKGTLLGKEGEGLKIALTTLDVCRATVGAAATGFARRALAEAIERTKGRVQFGKPLSEEPGVQAMLANMATELDAARLLVFRAAWTKDAGQARITREAAEAKLFATEAAQRIVDQALQLHGGLGVTKGVAVERLYREVRALRIYEGASEIQRLVIGRALAK